MAKIGNWGSYLKFSTNDNRILTFTNFRRKISARTAKHSIIGTKPRLEYLGKDLESITFTIELNAMLGVKPYKEEQRLIKKVGYVAPLVIGGKKICSKAMLTGLGDAYGIILKRRNIFNED
ncbi:MAG: phage tail protein [Enterocloster bolteae]